MVDVEPELLPAGIAIAAVCIANYTDLRSRIIPNRLTIPLIGVGTVFHALLGIWHLDFWTAISGGLGAAMAFVIGYLLWLTGGWAGGDVKLFTALGALLPFYTPPYVKEVPYPFPITILFNSFFAIFPILLIYTLYCRLQGRGALYEQIKITELREGMIPAETIYEKDGEIRRSSGFLMPRCDRIYANPRRAAGLTRYQVGVLKRLVRQRKLKNSIRVKKGVPFAPALGLGVFTAVFYGDLWWGFIQAFTPTW